VKDVLKDCKEMFPGLPVPSSAKLLSLEDLVAALRPLEMLTKRLCQANFNVLQVLYCEKLV
jgi:hypothetical protein